MEVGTVDFYQPLFWIFLLCGILFCSPVTDRRIREWVYAGLNLAFLACFLRPSGMLELGIGLLAVWLLLRVTAGSADSQLLFWIFVGLLAAVFLIHKLQGSGLTRPFHALNPLLTAIGASYALLRLVDVTRAVHDGAHRPPRPAQLVNYLLPFHMIAAGPIQAYSEFIDQPAVAPRLTFLETLSAAERIGTGLFKKFVIAALIQNVFLTGFESRGLFFALEIQLFFIWVFLDFSAYSDIAVGVGTLIGVRTPENFNRPYFARNLIDFWDRWHMSLSLFIRRNLFIPIQLKLTRLLEGRHPLFCASLSFTISFLSVGLWHGISWPFFFWGATQAIGLVMANAYRFALRARIGSQGMKRYMQNPWIRLASTLLTFEYIALTISIIEIPWHSFLH